MKTRNTILTVIAAVIILFSGFGYAQEHPVLTYPNGYESFNSGDQVNITWLPNMYEGEVSLQYSSDRGQTWVEIVSGLPNTGTYSWTVPGVNSSEFMIRISGGASVSDGETRGTWLWASSINTAEKRVNVLAKLKRANLNTILLSTPRVNDNWGYGSHESFIEFAQMAKAEGFVVHAWISNMRRLWGQGISYVDYREEAEQEAQAQWVVDILKLYSPYVEGIHLDYIRYAEFEDVNFEGKMEGVRNTVRRIRAAMKELHPDKLLSASVFTCKANRLDRKDSGEIWRNQVPQWYREWFENHPGTKFTSNNYYYYGPHHMQVQQDPVGWLKEGIIDFIMPMQYSMDDDYWLEESASWKSFNEFVGNDFTKIYSGLAWKTGKYDAEGLVRKIKLNRTLGLKGNFIFILCNHDIDDNPVIDALSIDSEANNFDAPYKEPAKSLLKASVVFDISDNTFTVNHQGDSDAVLKILSPNGGESFDQNSVVTVQWESESLRGNVNLEISSDNGISWTLLRENIANSGSSAVEITSEPSDSYLIKIVSADEPSVFDISDSAFSVKQVSGDFALISPNGGDVLTRGSSFTIRWATGGHASDVAIRISPDNGSTWYYLKSRLANTGSYTRRVPNVVSDRCIIEVFLRDDRKIMDRSDKVFSIK